MCINILADYNDEVNILTLIPYNAADGWFHNKSKCNSPTSFSSIYRHNHEELDYIPAKTRIKQLDRVEIILIL